MEGLRSCGQLAPFQSPQSPPEPSRVSAGHHVGPFSGEERSIAHGGQKVQDVPAQPPGGGVGGGVGVCLSVRWAKSYLRSGWPKKENPNKPTNFRFATRTVQTQKAQSSMSSGLEKCMRRNRARWSGSEESPRFARKWLPRHK